MTDINIDGIVTWLSNWFQDKLISGTNIKTINNQSLLGSGNISVGGSGGGLSFDDVYPVGSIYMSVNSTSPATLFGGTWEKIEDKFLLASGTNYSIGTSGGSADAVVVEHTHPQNEHYHNAYGSEYFVTNSQSSHANYRVGGASSGRWVDAFENSGTFKHHRTTNSATATNQPTGESGTGKNMPPYLAVNVWKRTA